MRFVFAFVALLPFAFSMAGPPVAKSAPPSSDVYHIVLSRRAAAAGEWVELRLVPPAPAGAGVSWGVASGTSVIGLVGSVYRAPFSIPPGTPPAKISAGISSAGGATTISSEIELIPSIAPGADDCLGPGQAFSKVIADLEQPFIHYTDGGDLIHREDPIYPRSALARGIEDRIAVFALICRTGRVIGVYAPPSYRNIGDPLPIEHDPKLVDAALSAAKKYVFAPATVDGQPVAYWADITVIFQL